MSDWQSISSAPFGKDLELSVIEHGNVHALMFPCHRTLNGWINATTKLAVQVAPTHWRAWDSGREEWIEPKER